MKRLSETAYHSFLDKIQRIIGNKMAKVINPLPITPNMVSGISFAFAIMSASFFSYGTYLYGILGVIAWQVSALFDYADGSLARLRGTASNLGDWVDRVLDFAKNFFFIFGIAWGLFTVTTNAIFLILGFMTISGLQFHIFLSYANAFSFSKGTHTKVKQNLGLLQKVISTSGSVLTIALIVCVFTNTLWLYLVVYGIFHTIWSITSFFYFFHKYKNRLGD